jgi:hypothetical protein
LFFAQLEAAETIIFLTKARADFRQGIDVSLDSPSQERQNDGFKAFVQYALKEERIRRHHEHWHVFEPQAVQAGGASARMIKAAERVEVRETITIGPKTTVARGRRYLTPEEFERQKAFDLIEVGSEERDKQRNLKRVQIRSYRYAESPTALVNRTLGEELCGKQNILGSEMRQ